MSQGQGEGSRIEGQRQCVLFKEGISGGSRVLFAGFRLSFFLKLGDSLFTFVVEIAQLL